ncbi:MFS transporter [Amphritea sp.]|uniref:MFS transporter n=1 Tax=Amphritea sp. TaxID=1872502 RepID=UPI003A945724
MIKTASKRGHIALMMAHCAGMLDLVALPVWIGTLVQYYKLEPQQAGSLATLFLFGAVIASITLAHRLHSFNGRWVAVIGFGLAALCFAGVSQTSEFSLMAILHVAAGLSVGAALSVTHGTIARSINPHRLFAIVSAALGVFSVIFYAAVPSLVAASGGELLFVIFGLVMLLASLVSVIAFPTADARLDEDVTLEGQPVKNTVKVKIPKAVWFGIVGISAMGLVQAMTFSFLERVGDANGFTVAAISGVLVTLGIVNLLPAPLAGLLQHRVSARWVLILGPGLQALISFAIMSTQSFMLYAISASLFAGVILFTHTFVFGVLARLDISGRALAATPAMMMTGAGIGPILGGSLVQGFGYQSIGIAAICIAVVSTFCFSRVHSSENTQSVQEPAA